MGRTRTQTTTDTDGAASEEGSEANAAVSGADSEKTDTDIWKRDLALAYIVTSIDASCKVMLHKVKFLVEACRLLKTTFYAGSQASADAKLSNI